MAFAFETKTWSYEGQKEFDNGGFNLLNPTISVLSVTTQEGNIYVTLKAIENGGVYMHHLNMQYNNSEGETNLDVVVDAAIAAAFPDFVLDE
jgi:hypothetical protein